METRRKLRALSLTPHLHPLPFLHVVSMEQRHPLRPLHMVPAKQIHTLVIAEQSRAISNGRKQRIEATIEERRHLEIQIHETTFIPIDRRGFNHLFPLLLRFLQLSNLFLLQLVPNQINLVPKISAKRRVEFRMVFIHRIFHQLFAPIHLRHDKRQAFPVLTPTRNMIGMQSLFTSTPTAQRPRMFEYFFNRIQRNRSAQPRILLRLHLYLFQSLVHFSIIPSNGIAI